MFAPSAAARLAISRPMPRLPPDMIMVRPASGLPASVISLLPSVRSPRLHDRRSEGAGVLNYPIRTVGHRAELCNQLHSRSATMATRITFLVHPPLRFADLAPDPLPF